MALTRARADFGAAGIPRQDRGHHSRRNRRGGADAAATCDVADMRRAMRWKRVRTRFGTSSLPRAASSISISSRNTFSSSTPPTGPRSRASARSRCSITPRGLGCSASPKLKCCAGCAALPRPDPDPPALRDRKIQSGNRGRKSVARDGARRRHPDFSALEARVRETQGEVRRVQYADRGRLD